MRVKGKTAACVWKIIAAVLAGVFVFWGLPQCEPAGVCEAREAEDEEKVEAFIKAYFKAYSEKDTASLEDYIQDEEDLEKELLGMEVLYECGFARYDHIETLVYPLSDKTHWIVVVSFDMVIEDLDDALPGLKTIFVGKNGDGDFYMETDEDAVQDLTEEAREIMLSDEVYDRSNEVQSRYNEILEDNPDAVDWVMKASDVQTKALSEAYEKKSRNGKEDYYLVKKGDCLWSIAENELGDGMYWGGIYEANQELIGEDPDLLYIGIKLQLPEVKGQSR